MSEDLYAKPDLTKKVRFQAGGKQDGHADICDDSEDATIYDNYCANEITAPHVEENTTQDQRQTIPESVSSEKRDPHHGRAAVLLGLLVCLLLLVTVTILSIILFQGQVSWNAERSQLHEKSAEMLTEQRKLQTDIAEIKNLNVNLTKKIAELPKLINMTRCPDRWTLFGDSCYFKPGWRQNWSKSRSLCKDWGADLVIISNMEEQVFVTFFRLVVWIGLSADNEDNIWRWVTGSVPITTYWKPKQPSPRRCAVIEGRPDFRNWNAVDCSTMRFFICEKKLK